MKIIEAKNLVKTYASQNRVLHDVSVDVKEGEFIVVMGPSGSGKSTLLLTLATMDALDEGSVVFEGQDLTKLSSDEQAKVRRKKMGFVFQKAHLLKNLNLLDNIIYPHITRDNLEEITQRALTLMERMGIEELSSRFQTEASGGQLQRACICRAIVHKPRIVFADEPTGALNSATSMEIMEIFKDLNQEGMTIFLVTHDAQVATFASRVIFLVDGSIEKELNFKAETPAQRLAQIEEVMHEYRI